MHRSLHVLLSITFLTCTTAQAGLFSRRVGSSAKTGTGCQQSSSHLEAHNGGLWEDARATARVARIGRSLMAKAGEMPVTCQFGLLDSSSRNAYSLSCGRIYLTRGLYEKLKSDDLLAAALAHEMGHVAAQDGKHPCSDDACQLQKELRADARGVRYLRLAGYRPSALSQLVHLLRADQPSGWAERRETALGGQVATLTTSHAPGRQMSGIKAAGSDAPVLLTTADGPWQGTAMKPAVAEDGVSTPTHP